ncbi:MbeB family mobilization protein [Vibrio sp. 2175-1]|nr:MULTISPECIES: MbeB family mobilization protein [Vibrio]MCA2494103.1 MbeB family mobilization protein [Vibrio alginolyticus]MDW2221203.1 MbeB family mobilization protein [Vibrio sp. 2175-1]
MSKILTMAKDFNTQSKKQADDIEQQLKQDFKKHEQRIQDALKASEQRITNDIQEQQSRLNRLVMKTWIWLPVSLFFLVITTYGIAWWQGQTILDNQQKIVRQQAILEQFQSKTWGVSLFESKGERYIVIPEGYKIREGWTMNDGQNELIKLEKK